jgi:hypothetical protein
MAKGNAGIGICSRRRSELSVGTGPAPLYVGMEIYNSAVFWHCFVASLGDGLMVLLIVAAGWIILHQQNWFQQPVVSGYLVMLTTAFFIAVMVE